MFCFEAECPVKTQKCTKKNHKVTKEIPDHPDEVSMQ